MSNNLMPENPHHSDPTRVFAGNVLKKPSILSEVGDISRKESRLQELEEICKNPRQSTELIKYLIDFIKSL